MRADRKGGRSTAGHRRNISLAGDLRGGTGRTNGVHAGAADPKRRIQERLAGYLESTGTTSSSFSAHDRTARRLAGRAGRMPARTAALRLLGSRARDDTLPSGAAKTHNVVEISAMQDQFSLLQPIGYLWREVNPAYRVITDPADRRRGTGHG